jgi:hypothetical protein
MVSDECGAPRPPHAVMAGSWQAARCAGVLTIALGLVASTDVAPRWSGWSAGSGRQPLSLRYRPLVRPHDHIQLGVITQFVTALVREHAEMPQPGYGIGHQSG